MKLLQKITPILLAALMLVGTSGFKVEKFYCGTHLQSIHIFTSSTPCCSKSNQAEGKCHTETEYVKADLNGDLPILSQKIDQPTTSLAILEVFVQYLFNPINTTVVKYLNYKPPLMLLDIPVLIQSFLI